MIIGCHASLMILDLRYRLAAAFSLFLIRLIVVVQENVWIDTEEGRMCCKLIAVHAGLEKSKGVDEQLKFLRARDTSIPKVEDLSGRANVWEIPQVKQTFNLVVLIFKINFFRSVSSLCLRNTLLNLIFFFLAGILQF